ncbi:MAG: transketolase [Brevinematales bacterium]|jgi:transketolase
MSATLSKELDQLSVNTIRFLAVDGVQKAESGHPGMPMGAAPMAYVLWTRFLKHNPLDPGWIDRDRFVLSAGHGSMLLYSLLHLTGYDLSLDELKNFRQWGSRTPGHPESALTPGVESTTGPLGQGLGNSVGMAAAEAWLSARFNRPGHNIIDHYTFTIAGDGDMMEGVASEAASLAGHLKLGKLICLYDDNRITLSASTGVSFTDDTARRYEAYGWHAQAVSDGNDLEAIENAIAAAKNEKGKPSIIIVHTYIGYGSPSKQGKFESHGSPLGISEVKKTKEALGWPDRQFYIPDEALAVFRQSLEKGKKTESAWKEKFSLYEAAYPQLAEELKGLIAGKIPEKWDSDIPFFEPDAKGVSTRAALGKVMNATAPRLTSLIGGSADLDPSTYTALKGLGDFESPDKMPADLQGSAGGEWNYSGRNIHFGVREHGMGAILNGLALHGGIIPYGSTFLVFSDYMRPSIRLAALMGIHVIYIFTHDSIGVGEDGPTHQPVEHISSLRAIPGLVVMRPGDANETALAWKAAIEMKGRPVALILSRQNLPVFGREYSADPSRVEKGAYILFDSGKKDPDIILIATGSEVFLALGAGHDLSKSGISARVVSMPCCELFDEQDRKYKDSVLPPAVKVRLAIEAGISHGWHRYTGDAGGTICIDRFGASAPGDVLMKKFGFTVENVVNTAMKLLNRN